MTDGAQSRVAGRLGLYARVAAIGVFGLVVAWLAISETEALRLSSTNPAASLSWRRSNSEGLAAAEQAALAGATTPQEYQRVKEQIRDELARAPLTVGAFRDLAEAIALSENSAKVDDLMTMADRLTHRDGLTERWLVFHRLAAKDYPEAMLQADLLARRNPDTDEWALFLPQMTPALRSTAARQALVSRLVRRSAWRPVFMGDLVDADPDEAVVADIFLRLHALHSGPDPDEIGRLMNRMLGEKRFVEARELWQALGGHASVGSNLIYDGDFEGWNGPPPFNWRLQNQAGVFGELAPTPEGGKALRAELPGDNADLLAEQLVVAPPGRYRFSGRVKVDQLASGGSFQWTVSCSTSNIPLGKATGASVGPWQAFQLDFTAPADCGPLSVRLQTDGGDGGGQAIAWSDRLALTPLPAQVSK